MIEPNIGSASAEPKKSATTLDAADSVTLSMQRSLRFAAELQSLNAEINDLEYERHQLPEDALIQTLFQLAIIRIEERIVTLQRITAVTAEGLNPDLDPTEAVKSRLLGLLAKAH